MVVVVVIFVVAFFSFFISFYHIYRSCYDSPGFLLKIRNARRFMFYMTFQNVRANFSETILSCLNCSFHWMVTVWMNHYLFNLLFLYTR